MASQWPLIMTSQRGNDISRDAHCEITMGNDVAKDIHCDVTMSNDIAMYTYHAITMHNEPCYEPPLLMHSLLYS